MEVENIDVWKAHFHLTIEGVSSEDLMMAAKLIGAKCTTIDLHKDKFSQKDRMLTKYQRGMSKELMWESARKLEKAGFKVVRCKLERMFKTLEEALSQDVSYENYGEVHLKVPSGLKNVPTKTFKISTNQEDMKHKFYNARLYSKSDVECFKQDYKHLIENGVVVKSFHAEQVIIDTNHNLDAWWA